jgi:uracil-DNA glycosylase
VGSDTSYGSVLTSDITEGDLLIHIEYDEVESNLHDIQIIAYAVDCVQYDKNKRTAIITHKPGTVKLCKTHDGKKCIAMYCVVMEKRGKYEECISVKDTLKYLLKCLDKISRAKNLRSIAFEKDIVGGARYIDIHGKDRYITALQKFSENVEALVYVYSVKDVKNTKKINTPHIVNTVHRSFGDLLGQIKIWKKEKAGWDVFFRARIEDKTIVTLNAFLQKEVEEYYVYPQPEEIFNDMILCKVSDIKVIVIGQNPYYVPNAAMGLAFSHKDDYVKLQPSLRNIYKELTDCGYKTNMKSGNLTRWSKEEGVFLINTGLTVRQGQADSHMKEWKPFTEHLFKFLNERINHAVIIMWGAPAQTYSKFFDDKKHKKIMTSHPCPMSANISFFGSKPFIKCNQYLKEWGIKEVDWNLV